jgi:hypothetical protein
MVNFFAWLGKHVVLVMALKKSHFTKEAIDSPKKGEDIIGSDRPPSSTWKVPLLGIVKWKPTTKSCENHLQWEHWPHMKFMKIEL